MAQFESEMVVGPIGPDTLRLPGGSARLRQAAQALRDLVASLEHTGQQLKQANPRGDYPGKVVRAVAGVAQRTGRVLDADVQRLRELAGALEHESDVLRDAQSATMPELRSRWHAARADLTQAVADDATEGGHGARAGHGGARTHHHDAHSLARSLDGVVLADYAHLVHHWLGAEVPSGDGDGHLEAMMVGGALDTGIQRYRHTVRSVMEDWADAVRRAESADQQVEGKLARHDEAVLVGSEVDSDAGAPGVSAPDEIQRLTQELGQARSALHDVVGRLEDVRLQIREGRMLPRGERSGSSDGFQRTWHVHLDGLRDSLESVGHHSDTILRRIRQLEDEGAHEIRRAGRAG